MSSSLTGKSHSEEHRRNNSKAHKGINLGVSKEEVACPHCGKIGGRPAMHRWHFDNCKNKPIDFSI